MADILPALNCLNAAQDEDILQNRQQTLQVLARLRNVLKSDVKASSHDDVDRLVDGCIRVLSIIQKRLCSIRAYATQSAKKAVAEASRKREDPRIVDVQVYDGAKEKTDVLKFRKAMAIRSLSLEFMRFQEGWLNYSRVGLQANELSSAADQTQDGAIEKFIDFKKHVSDRKMARTMIKNGTKMLVLERLYGHCGITAILWIVPSWTKLSYASLSVFLELLTQAPEYHIINTTATDLDDWYEECQTLYDEKIAIAQLAQHEIIPSETPRKARTDKQRRDGIRKQTRPRKHQVSAHKIDLTNNGHRDGRVNDFTELSRVKGSTQHITDSARQLQHGNTLHARPKSFLSLSRDEQCSSLVAEQPTGHPDMLDAGVDAYPFFPQDFTDANRLIRASGELDVLDSGVNTFPFIPSNLSGTASVSNAIPPAEPEIFDSGISSHSFTPGNLFHTSASNTVLPAGPEMSDSGTSSYSFTPDNLFQASTSNAIPPAGPEIFDARTHSFPFVAENPTVRPVSNGTVTQTRFLDMSDTGRDAPLFY